MDTETTPDTGLKALRSWLVSPVTLPGWALAAGAIGGLVLLLVALD